MPESLAILPINIIGATFVVEFCLFLIVAVGIYMINDSLTSNDNSLEVNYNKKYLPQMGIKYVVIAAIMVVCALLISDSFFSVASPLFQGLTIPTISNRVSVNIIFVLNLVLVTHLIWCSGGVENSPFTAVFFILPAIAIFLRLQAYVFIICTLYVAVTYLIILYRYSDIRHLKGKHANAMVNTLCFGLTLLIGYITRPIAIG